jgi:hypothetical protein
MFSEQRFEERIWRGRWLVIPLVVVMALAAIQVIRVNRPEEKVEEEVPTITYTARGPLLAGNLWVEPNAFHVTRIDLNRKAKLAGTFNTPSSKEKVHVLVFDEANFETWKAGGEYHAIVTTRAVPWGRISPVVGPGTFFLVIDNRASDKKQSVDANFSLD